MIGCTITDEYTYRGADVVVLENNALRVEVLAGKGGDITELRDKRTDVNLLYESPAEWHVPGDGAAGLLSDGNFDFMDYYPGGWQDVLPAAGGPSNDGNVPFALHGESTVVPWNAVITEDSADRVSVTLSLSLTRYPFEVERELSLERGSAKLVVDERVTNVGEVDVAYSWLQHIDFGEPFLSPATQIEVPCETVLSDPDFEDPNSRFPPGEAFEWPVCTVDGQSIDLRDVPPKESRVHDLLALTDLTDGRYTVSNPDLDLAATVTFPADHFEYLWYWAPFGGFEGAPYFGRNYNLGLEPCTSIPNAGLDAQIENDTAARLPAGSSIDVQFTVETAPVRT